LLKGFGKNGKTPNVGQLASDVSKAASKMTKGFTRAEFTGGGLDRGCDVVGDVGTLDGAESGHVAEVLTLLDGGTLPGCAAELPATGQTTCWARGGTVIACAGTGHDGDIQAGAALSYTDNGDGTITDNLTKLIWLKNANCFGGRGWATALSDANTLANGICGLTDGSSAGDWRWPNRNELSSLINLEFFSPAISDAAGTAKWTTNGDAFDNIPSVSSRYWSSTSFAFVPSRVCVLVQRELESQFGPE
jgi:hypothetical protein